MDDRFRDKLAAALAQEGPGYDERRSLQGGRPAGVLVLLGASRAKPDQHSLLITRRTDLVGSHKGQMAFPGGMSEPHELSMGARGFVSTALRETQEEVGISPSLVSPVGNLPELTTITNYRVTPVVAMLREPIENVPFALNAHEIAEALWIELARLQEPGIYRTEYIRVGAINHPVHAYQVGQHRIWGATASMIKNLLDRLQALG